jgi:tetratricopeptide (TPR) repeat protein
VVCTTSKIHYSNYSILSIASLIAKEVPSDILPRLQQLEKEGVVLAEEQKLDEALDKLSQAIAICDYYASVYNNRAQVYRLKGDVDSALADLNLAMKHGVGQPKILRQAYTQRAIIRKQKGDIEGAQADFERGNVSHIMIAWTIYNCSDNRFQRCQVRKSYRKKYLC